MGWSLVNWPFRDLRPLVTSYVTGLWRSDWENDSKTNYKKINASVDTLCPMMKSWREKTALTRLCIGHSHVTHAHLLRGDPPPACACCRQSLSICHLLITCPCYVPIRSRHYCSNNLTHLLTHVQPFCIFSFLTEITFYDKIWLFTFNLNFLCFYLLMYFACLHSCLCVTIFLMYFSLYWVLHSFFCLPSSTLHVTLTSEFCFPKRLSLRTSRHEII